MLCQLLNVPCNIIIFDFISVQFYAHGLTIVSESWTPSLKWQPLPLTDPLPTDHQPPDL